jgi:hypothetical protein
MKKLFVIAVLGIFLSTQAIAPRKAHAVLGGGVALLSGGIGVLVVGGVISAASWGTIGVVQFLSDRSQCGGGSYACLMAFLTASAGAVIGFVVLDENGQAVPQYTALTADQASELGITPMELDHYNQEIPSINAVTETVTYELARSDQPTLEQSTALWNSYKSAISPDAYSAMAKIAQGATKAN